MELLAVHDFVPDEHGGVKPRVLHDERVRVLREEVEHAVVEAVDGLDDLRRRPAAR